MSRTVAAGRPRPLAAAVTALLVVGAAPAPGRAQPVPPESGGLIRSLGQPPRWKAYGGLAAGRSYRDSVPAGLGLFQLGLLRDVTNPVVGLFAVAGEVYGGHAERVEYGVRALAVSPLLGLTVGVDASLRHDELRPLFRVRAPIRRGGFITRGGEIRLTWVPGRQLTAGLSVPLRQPAVGRTRPRQTRVPLDRPRPSEPASAPTDPAISDAIARAGRAAGAVAWFTLPFLDQGGRRDRAMDQLRRDMASLRTTLLARTRGTSGPAAAIEATTRFHAALGEAFERAADGPVGAVGERAVDVARSLALEHVVLPYDRLLGLDRSHDTTREFAAVARGPFAAWLVARSGIPESRHDAVLGVFEAYLDILEDVREQVRGTWGDARLAWIPLQLALTPDQHDEQAEIDELLSRAVQSPFLDGNRVRYLSNVEWQEELLAGVRRAEDYHVLWIHDIDGLDDAGAPDALTLRYVVDGYLASLTSAVASYDETGRLPVFLIFIDQYYYERHDTRRWLTLLEHPLDRAPPVPEATGAVRDTLDRALGALRRAVAGSRLLQRQRSQYGRSWLENRVKVHVNITNPADPSFWGNQFLPMLSLPDNLMRDHRKLAFYDLTEEDPYRGSALFGGMGIGEHYSGPEWEDRGIIVQGPAAIEAKSAVLELLRSQGFDEPDIPYPLQPRPTPPDYDETVAATAAREPAEARALQIHNQTGYLPKRINVAKATLYTLMPPGSVIIIPDSLWNSELWASMLLGSCLRGVRVLLIVPARGNAPGRDDFLPMSRAHELLERLLIARDELGGPMGLAGGELHLGLYDPRLDATDARQRALTALDGLEDHPAIRRLLPLAPETDALISDAARLLRLARRDTTGEAPTPKLHAKIQLFATPEAWDVLARRDLAGMLAAGLGAGRDVLGDVMRRGGMTDVGTLGPVYQRYLEGLPATMRERAAILLMVGSSNQDYRSMLSDGEVAILISGRGAARALPDFVSFLGLSSWIEDRQELDLRLPRYGGFRWWFSRLFRKSI